MRALYLTAIVAAAAAASFAVPVLAQTPQVAPVRVEFTRPAGTPGLARGIVRPSETYMMAPAQPEQGSPSRPRKRR